MRQFCMVVLRCGWGRHAVHGYVYQLCVVPADVTPLDEKGNVWRFLFCLQKKNRI